MRTAFLFSGMDSLSRMRMTKVIMAQTIFINFLGGCIWDEEEA